MLTFQWFHICVYLHDSHRILYKRTSEKRINDEIDFKVPMKNVKTTHAAQNEIRCAFGASKQYMGKSILSKRSNVWEGESTRDSCRHKYVASKTPRNHFCCMPFVLYFVLRFCCLHNMPYFSLALQFRIFDNTVMIYFIWLQLSNFPTILINWE